MAARLLADWDHALTRLRRVMPRDYQRVLTAARRAEREGRDVAHRGHVRGQRLTGRR